MVQLSQVNGEDAGRTRKPHKKSRQGCRNCKLRRVKCDERKPKCEKCTAFGVACNYGQRASDSDLQTAHGGVVGIKWIESPQIQQSPPPLPVSLYPTSRAELGAVFKSAAFQLDQQESDRLYRFATRTILTIGTMQTSHIYQNAIPSLVHSYPYLMHVVQTITAIHDRHLSPCSSPQHTTVEMYHWSRAASLFNAALSAPIRPEDRDALWGTAALLGSIAFSSIEATTVFEAWPLAPPSRQDLEWLRMSSGKASIWAVTDPLREDSVYAPLKLETEMQYLFAREPKYGIADLPAAFIELCELDENSTSENNPYHAAVSNIAPLLNLDCDRNNMVRFLSFISHVQPDYTRLLEEKDARAMLVLAFWFAKVLTAVWWIERRALLECSAICIYLERWYPEEKAIMRLLAWPKMRCGLLEVDHEMRVELEYDWSRILDDDVQLVLAG